MRETKEQKIIRLEQKITKLEAELKNQKTVSKKQIKDLKDVQKDMNSQTQTEFKEQLKKLQNEYKELDFEYKKLWDKYYTTILRNSRSKKSALFSIYLTLGNDTKFYKQIEEDNKKRFDSYHKGEILDPYGNLYFFDENLMITINPKNGERLNLSQLTKIYSILKNQKEYLSALTEVEQFRKTNNGAEYLMFVDNKGRELFERFYSNFQF